MEAVTVHKYMKKTLNATASKTLMVCLNPGVTSEIAEQRLKEKAFHLSLIKYIDLLTYIY